MSININPDEDGHRELAAIQVTQRRNFSWRRFLNSIALRNIAGYDGNAEVAEHLIRSNFRGNEMDLLS